MLENKDYCDYELRLGLRDIGYPMSTCQINDGPIQMPKITLYEAQKFLREEKKIEVNATYDNVIELHWHWYMKSLTNCNQTTSIINYDSYEQALLAGIKVAVKILKENETIYE